MDAMKDLIKNTFCSIFATLLISLGVHANEPLPEPFKIALVTSVKLNSFLRCFPCVCTEENLDSVFLSFPARQPVQKEIYHQVSLVELYHLFQRPDLHSIILFSHIGSHPDLKNVVIPGYRMQDLLLAFKGIPEQKRMFIGLCGCHSSTLLETIEDMAPQVDTFGFPGKIALIGNHWQRCLRQCYQQACSFSDVFKVIESVGQEISPPELVVDCILTRLAQEASDSDNTQTVYHELLILDAWQQKVLGAFSKANAHHLPQTCPIRFTLPLAWLDPQTQQLKSNQKSALNLHCKTGYGVHQLKYVGPIGIIKSTLSAESVLKGEWWSKPTALSVLLKWVPQIQK